MTMRFWPLACAALMQIVMPVPAEAVVFVPGCGDGNSSVPIRIPMKDRENSSCCGKLCHVNDRKRSSGQCCGPEDEDDT